MIPTCYNCGWRYLGKDAHKCPVNGPNCGSSSRGSEKASPGGASRITPLQVSRFRSISIGSGAKEKRQCALHLIHSETLAMASGASVLLALLEGLGMRVPPGAEKPELVALVLAQRAAHRLGG